MKTILLIDDEEAMVESLARFIRRRGHNVLVTTKGDDGLELYEKNKPDYVFLDMHLPEMDGVTVLNKMKEINSQAKIYFITGDGAKDLKNEVESLGIEDFMLKPLDMDYVTRIIEEE
jgi:DNA-binding response OmpR family regulator